MNLWEKEACNKLLEKFSLKKKIIQPQTLHYIQYLESLNEEKFLEYISRIHFVALFQPGIHLWYQPYLNMSPDIFFEYISQQPISVIRKALKITKNYKPKEEKFPYMVFHDYDYKKISIEVYQEVTIKLESILQFINMNENLPKGHNVKNSGGKI